MAKVWTCCPISVVTDLCGALDEQTALVGVEVWPEINRHISMLAATRFSGAGFSSGSAFRKSLGATRLQRRLPVFDMIEVIDLTRPA